jgi:hypothetical protein
VHTAPTVVGPALASYWGQSHSFLGNRTTRPVRFSFVAYHLAPRFSPPFRGPNPFCPPRLPAATSTGPHSLLPRVHRAPFTPPLPLMSSAAHRRPHRKASRSMPSALAAPGKAAPLRWLAPARLGRPLRARRLRSAALPAATLPAPFPTAHHLTARRSRPQYRGCPARRAEAPLRDACAGACWHPREESWLRFAA